jgi:hypothetical protein
MLTRRSRTLIATARRHVAELVTEAHHDDGRDDLLGLSRGAGSAAKPVASINELVRTAERALGRRDPVLAFAASAEAAQAGQQAAAAARLHRRAEQVTLDELAAQVGGSAERLRASIRARVHATAERPVTKVAQLTALSDTLAWGVFALTSIDVAVERLKGVRTEAELEEIVRFLETARFEAATYMAACAESLEFIGRHPIGSDTVDLLDAYSELIAYAADTNRRYADRLGLATGESSYLEQLLDASDRLADSVSPVIRDLRGQTSEPALRLAVALLEYVESTQLVNDLTSHARPGSEAPPNLEPIEDPRAVRTQARTAEEIAREQVREIAAAGLDPSFVQWNSRWGADLAFGRLPNATDEQTLHGLEFQWFAVLQSRLLRALEDT